MTIIEGKKVVCKDDFEKFKLKNSLDHQEINKKLDKLDPLLLLTRNGRVETLDNIIENQKTIAKLGKWTVKILGFIGLVVGIIYTIYRLIKS